MLDEPLKTQLAAYLERVTLPFEMVATLDDSETSRDTRELLETIQSLRADKISVRFDGSGAEAPRGRRGWLPGFDGLRCDLRLRP